MLDKYRNLFKFVSVLLSASVERFGVSRMRDFYLSTTNRSIYQHQKFNIATTKVKLSM